MATETGTGARGIDLVVRYLEERDVGHDVVDHEQTFSAQAEARAAGVAPDHAAKSVLLRDGDQYRLAVIPASQRLDLRKVRDVLGGSGHLRLATEAEMEADFGAFDVGALPPLGPMLPAAEAMDSQLLGHDRILCTGGDHRHSVLVDPNDLARITEAAVADVCEEETLR
jgi:Ala-tRNA(Pro) deacylase